MWTWSATGLGLTSIMWTGALDSLRCRMLATFLSVNPAVIQVFCYGTLTRFSIESMPMTCLVLRVWNRGTRWWARLRALNRPVLKTVCRFLCGRLLSVLGRVKVVPPISVLTGFTVTVVLV